MQKKEHIIYKGISTDTDKEVSGVLYVHDKVHLGVVSNNQEILDNEEYYIVYDELGCDWNFQNKIKATTVYKDSVKRLTYLKDASGKYIYTKDKLRYNNIIVICKDTFNDEIEKNYKNIFIDEKTGEIISTYEIEKNFILIE